MAYALHTYNMSVTDQTQAKTGQFEEASQKLLLDLAMEASNQELRNMVARRRKPANVPNYYRSLQICRSPILHRLDA